MSLKTKRVERGLTQREAAEIFGLKINLPLHLRSTFLLNFSLL